MKGKDDEKQIFIRVQNSMVFSSVLPSDCDYAYLKFFSYIQIESNLFYFTFFYQGACGCHIPGGIQGQAGCGSGQPGQVVGDPARSREVETQ